jgi:hypothetical protein
VGFGDTGRYRFSIDGEMAKVVPDLIKRFARKTAILRYIPRSFCMEVKQ